MVTAVRGKVLCLLLVVTALLQARAGEPEKGVPAGALIYYDRSPGSLALVRLWKPLVAADSVVPPTLVTTEEEFAESLQEGPWTSVVAVLKWSSANPGIADALRAYCAKHPDRLVHLFFWHDNGEKVPDHCAALGTTAIVLWRGGNTTTGYALAVSPRGKDAKPRTTPGLTFPDFKGVKAASLTVLATFTDNPRIGVVQPVKKDPFEVACYRSFTSESEICRPYLATHTGYCADLYGPKNKTDIGQPLEQAACMSEAVQDYATCIQAAMHRYVLCMKRCQGRPPAQPNPAQTKDKFPKD